MEHNYRHEFFEDQEDRIEQMLIVKSAGIYSNARTFYEENGMNNGYYFLCVLDGNGYIGENERLHPVSAGYAGLLNLEQPYRMYSDQNRPWTLGWVHFGGHGAEWFFNEICRISNFFLLPAEAARHNMEALLSCMKKNKTECHLQASALMYKILSDLYEISRDMNNSYIPCEKYPDVIEKVATYIQINYFRKLTLTELAHEAYLSPYHLLREFKKHMGLTPLEYTNLYRMALAKQRLQTSDISIEQIALSIGFCNHSYFTKCFRDMEGMTPESYRMQFRTKPNQDQ